ncbi:MotA/TolQ/ExbB proton channel family protein [Ruminococcus sp. HUN007]|uniref:MotA/TolQ/ExbB proton channel family protein n=1 Tax=Ruminococcus sp. HUN007 TaxID=1514668 RepID=UPI0005D1D0E5|nr:MotA/TolQ/ExbB proton channel family protein [Ruminococcus sp. HUN007]
MAAFLEGLTNPGNVIIICLGIALFLAMYKNYTVLSGHKNHINELITRQNRRYRTNQDTHELEEIDDEDSSVTPDTIRKHENEFDKSNSWHNVFAQLIPVFPLMGVLGTVWGLVQEVAADNIEKMLSSLNTAMTTTLSGLIFAIGLKIFDAFCPSKTINDVDVMLEDYYKKLDFAKMYETNKDDDK